MGGGLYTPALQITSRTKVIKKRELPLRGRAVVAVGAKVRPTDPVLAAERPGEIEIVRIADQLGILPEELEDCVTAAKGDKVQRGQLLCERRSFFGLFTSRVTAPCSGTVEFYTKENGHVGIRHKPIPFTVLAFLGGTVTEVDSEKSVTIEAEAALLQGIFGVGGERFGTIMSLPLERSETVSPALIDSIGEKARGCILAGGACFEAKTLERAAHFGAVAAVTGSIDSATLSAYVGMEIGVSVTGDEDVPMTVVITEGFGRLQIAQGTWDLLRSLEGREASISGATQVRAGAVRPELISVVDGSAAQGVAAELHGLDVGARIRCIRFPYFGELGRVVALPVEPHEIETGAKVRVLEAKLDRGESVLLPRANIELIT